MLAAVAAAAAAAAARSLPTRTTSRREHERANYAELCKLEYAKSGLRRARRKIACVGARNARKNCRSFRSSDLLSCFSTYVHVRMYTVCVCVCVRGRRSWIK